MSEVPSELLYTEEHEYLGPTDEDMVYTVGITDFAQGELGDIVYVELPSVGRAVEQGKPCGSSRKSRRWIKDS